MIRLLFDRFFLILFIGNIRSYLKFDNIHLGHFKTAAQFMFLLVLHEQNTRLYVTVCCVFVRVNVSGVCMYGFVVSTVYYFVSLVFFCASLCCVYHIV